MQARSNRALVAIRRFMIDREDSHGASRDQGRYGTPYSILETVRIVLIIPDLYRLGNPECCQCGRFRQERAVFRRPYPMLPPSGIGIFELFGDDPEAS